MKAFQVSNIYGIYIRINIMHPLYIMVSKVQGHYKSDNISLLPRNKIKGKT